MAILFEGDCKGKGVDVEVGGDRNSKPVVRWNMLVTKGPHEGKKASYKGKLDPENIKYTKRDMIALGWKPRDGKYKIETFVDDVKAADLEVPFMAEIASWEDPDTGKLKQWTSARSIGFAAAPLAPLDKEKAADVNSWFDEVPDVGGGDAGNGAPPRRSNPNDIPF